MSEAEAQAILANSMVSIEASSFDPQSGDWTSLVVKGHAAVSEDHLVGARAVELLRDKYRTALGDPLGRGGLQPLASLPHVVEVRIELLSGMCSGRAFAVPTRPGRF